MKVSSIIILALILTLGSCTKEKTLDSSPISEIRSSISTNPVIPYIQGIETIRQIVTDSQSLFTNQVYGLDSSITAMEGLLNMYGSDGIQEFTRFSLIEDSLTINNTQSLTGSQLKTVFTTLTNSLRSQFNSISIPNKNITYFDFHVTSLGSSQSKVYASAQVVSSLYSMYPTSLNYNCSTQFSSNVCFWTGHPDLDESGYLISGGECSESYTGGETNAQEEIQYALQDKVAKSGLYYIYSRTKKYPTKVEVSVKYLDITNEIEYSYSELNDIINNEEIPTEGCDYRYFQDIESGPTIDLKYYEDALSCHTCLLESIIDIVVPENRSVSYINIYGLGLITQRFDYNIHWFMKIRHAIPVITITKTPDSNEDLGSTPFSVESSFMIILNNNTTDEVFVDETEFSNL